MLTLGTAQNASGTAVDFLNIPATARRITVMFNGVSTNGGSQVQVQLGAGSIQTSGYNSVSVATAQTNAVQSTTSVAGFVVFSGGASDTTIAHMVLTNVSGNAWLASHCGQRSGWGLNGGANVSLSGTLDRIRITTVNGADVFDAGTINIMVE